MNTARTAITTARTTRTNPIERVRRRCAIWRWISSRLIRASSRRSALVGRRPSSSGRVRPGWFLSRANLSSWCRVRKLTDGCPFAPCRCAAYAPRDFPVERRRSTAGRLVGEGHGHDRSRSSHQGGRAAVELARPLLQDLGARIVRADGDHRRVRDLVDDGLHPVRQPDDPRGGPGQRRNDAFLPAGAHRDRPRRRGHDARDGHLRELPVRDRGRARAERVRGVHARRDAGAHVAAGDGRHRRSRARSSRSWCSPASARRS